MHSKVKKILVFALVLTMLMPLGSAFAAEENADDANSAVTDTEGEEAVEEEIEEEEDESVDIDTETTVDYVKNYMKFFGYQGQYRIYKGTVKNTEKMEGLIEYSDKVDAEDYTEESYAAYSQALEEAKAALENSQSTQYELDYAWIKLDRANDGLVEADDEPDEDEEPEEVKKDKLVKEIEKQDTELVAEDYTEYTWEIYRAALDNANAVNNDPNATQAAVDAAVEELKYTENKLTLNPSEIFAIIYFDGTADVLTATFDVGEAEEGAESIISMSKNEYWVIETDLDVTGMTSFYSRLASQKIDNAFVKPDLNSVFFIDTKTLEIEKEYVYSGESDDDNGRKYTSDDGRIAYVSLDGKRLLADVKLIAKNANLEFYADEVSQKLAVYDVKGDKMWWNTAVDPYGDSTVINFTGGETMKLPERNKASSGLMLEYADLRQEKRTVTTLYSTQEFMTGKKGSEKWEFNDNGLTITYDYKEVGFSVPVDYVLYEDRLEVSVDMSKVVEADTNSVDGKVITSLAINPYFGASPATDLAGNEVDGYMIVPDGSGAVIEYNNGKEGYESYSQILYGRDKTRVPDEAPKVTEQAYLPLIATVSGNNGLVAIATAGDTNATVYAQVSKQNKQAFNNAWFWFTLRSKDEYKMGGNDGTKITVFEKGDIKTDKIAVSYYPINTAETQKEEVNYADVAKVYRDYLINEKGLVQKTEADTSNFYVDLYGGVLKQTSVFGIPVDMKTEVTGFSQAGEILKKLSENGVSDIVVNYNEWTNKDINGKISTKFKPSGTLGGKDDYEQLVEDAKALDAKIFPSISNMQMRSSSWGYFTMNSTAIRVSNAQSRQSHYSIAFGVQLSGTAPALLTPNAYTKAMNQMIDSFTKNDVSTIGFGDYANTLVSDFSKRNALSREGTAEALIENYKKASEKFEDVIAEEANAYLIPYVDYITNVPVYSSQFNVVDYDIPLYQMVLHGYVPYSSTPVNASSNAEEVFLLALASGSGLHYDMIYRDAYELLDTGFSDLYYANYNSWIEEAAEQYKISEEILSQVSQMVITDYQIDTETGVIKTTYDNSVVVTIDTKNATADVNGTAYDLSLALEGGLQG